MPTPDVSATAITYPEFYYLLGRYPFLDLHHPADFTSVNGRSPEIISIQGGWEIQDFGDWIKTSPGLVPYEGFNQMLDMAEEMILLAIAKGWPAVYVDGGFYHMVRAAWVAAGLLDFPFEGFDPSYSDLRVRLLVERLLTERVRRLRDRLAQIQEQIRLNY